MTDSSPCVSFIGIVDFTQEARWIFASESVTDLLGYEPHEIIGRSSLELVHPDEFVEVKQIHYDTISQDKAATIAYLRLKHKDPQKGYVLCAVSRTTVHDVLVGSVSFATPGAKAMHNASTAQEITIITPSAKNFELRRWNDKDPMLATPPPQNPSTASSPRSSPAPSSSAPDDDGSDPSGSGTESDRSDADEDDGEEGRGGPSSSAARRRSKKAHRGQRKQAITFDRLPIQSVRTALILDRFSVKCGIMYCSNDFLLRTTDCMGRSFFDYVASKDEDLVRSWIDVIKSWGVNERGQPSDGGFGFGKFRCLSKGRDSSRRDDEPSPTSPRHRQPRSSPVSPTIPRQKRRHRGESGSGSGRLPGVKDYEPESFHVDAIFSAHSDGLLVILRGST